MTLLKKLSKIVFPSRNREEKFEKRDFGPRINYLHFKLEGRGKVIFYYTGVPVERPLREY
jgi:hypothetical protein